MSTIDLFQPIGSNRLSDQTVEQIRALIVDGVLQPGDRLPSERRLVKKLAVSRTILREALRVLEARGLVSVQPGVGTFVADRKAPSLPQSWINWLIDHRKEFVNLLEVSEALQPTAGALAAERITEDELEVIVQTLSKLERSWREFDIDLAVEADTEFHDLLCRATQNEFLVKLNDSLNHALIESRHAFFQEVTHIYTSWKHHCNVVAALRKGDPQEVSTAMLEHILSTKQRISNSLIVTEAGSG